MGLILSSRRRVAAHIPCPCTHTAVAGFPLHSAFVPPSNVLLYPLQPLPLQPVSYLYIVGPFIPFRLPRARKVCLSSTPPSQMESSLLPMIDNVRGDKAIVRLDCRMHFQKTGFIVFFFLYFSGPSIPPWASTISLVPDVAEFFGEYSCSNTTDYSTPG